MARRNTLEFSNPIGRMLFMHFFFYFITAAHEYIDRFSSDRSFMEICRKEEKKPHIIVEVFL